MKIAVFAVAVVAVDFVAVVAVVVLVCLIEVKMVFACVGVVWMTSGSEGKRGLIF